MASFFTTLLETVTINGIGAVGKTQTRLDRFPQPGTSTLHPLDCIQISNVTLPLDRPIEAGTELDIEKRKAPGSDYSTYVSHGLDSTPIRISIRLFVDMVSGKNWFTNYELIRDQLISKTLSRRNGIPVFHPLLDLEGITSVVFVKRSVPKSTNGLFFVVDLEGYNPKTLRVGSGGANTRIVQDLAVTSNASTTDAQGRSKPVTQYKQNSTTPAARGARANVRTPAQNAAGRDTRPTGSG